MAKLLNQLLEMYGVSNSDPSAINDPVTVAYGSFDHRFDPNTRSGLHPNISSPLRPDPPLRPLSGWQEDFRKRILNKQDTYMNAPPAAGKTNPILAAFSEMFINAISPNTRIDFKSPKFPRLIYIGRTKQLAIESMVQNFRGDKDYGLINLVLKYSRELGLHRLHQSQAQSTITPSDYNELIKFINNEMLAIKIGGTNPDLRSSIFEYKPIIIMTPDTSGHSAVLALLKSKPEYFSIVIIDEMQEYIPRPGAGELSADADGFFKYLIDVVSYAKASPNCGVHLLTGTTNAQTGEQIMKEFNSKFNRNFKSLQNMNWSNNFSDISKINPTTGMVDYAGNRSKLILKAYPNMIKVEDKLALIRRIVVNKQANSIIVMFSTNAASAMSILRLLPQVYKGLLPLETQKDGVNISNPDSLYSKDEHGNNATINTFGDAVKLNTGGYTLKNVNPHLYNNYPPRFAQMDNIEFLKYFDIEKVNVKGGGEGDEQLYSNNPIENNILYQGVLHGIGILFGKMDNRHKETVISLFRAGKIYCLLATNALGVGANVLCKDIYLTSTRPPPSFTAMDKSSLLQLIHRAGRDMQNIPYASVYVHPSDYEWVYRALNQDPETAVEAIDKDLISKAFRDKEPFISKIVRLFTRG